MKLWTFAYDFGKLLCQKPLKAITKILGSRFYS